MASNGNNVKVLSDDGTTAPVPQNADLWHSRALSGHLRASGEDAGVDRRVDCEPSASWSPRTLGRRDVEGLPEMLQLDLEGRPRLLQHRHRHRRLRGHSFFRLAVRVGKQRGHQ